MDDKEKALIDRLAKDNPTLAALVGEHQGYEARLAEMDKRPWLSPEDDMERKKIQKAKLAAKDKIHRILAEHQA